MRKKLDGLAKYQISRTVAIRADFEMFDVFGSWS